MLLESGGVLQDVSLSKFCGSFASGSTGLRYCNKYPEIVRFKRRHTV